jgi:hypothetical protein
MDTRATHGQQEDVSRMNTGKTRGEVKRSNKRRLKKKTADTEAVYNLHLILKIMF